MRRAVIAVLIGVLAVALPSEDRRDVRADPPWLAPAQRLGLGPLPGSPGLLLDELPPGVLDVHLQCWATEGWLSDRPPTSPPIGPTVPVYDVSVRFVLSDEWWDLDTVEYDVTLLDFELDPIRMYNVPEEYFDVPYGHHLFGFALPRQAGQTDLAGVLVIDVADQYDAAWWTWAYAIDRTCY